MEAVAISQLSVAAGGGLPKGGKISPQVIDKQWVIGKYRGMNTLRGIWQTIENTRLDRQCKPNVINTLT
jgi:hypothetical protein